MNPDLCPAPEMLSAYLDGKLDPIERAAIEDHISRCEDCYFVVKESRLAQPEVPAASAAPSASLSPRWLLPLAASLIVGVGALTLWRQARPTEPYSDLVKPLVEAVGERRFFEPRLTGGFKYGPTVTSKRAAGAAIPSESWAAMAVAGEMRQGPEPASMGSRASRAAAALLLGEVDLAVAEYSRLVEADPANAAWSSDLAAALLVRASSARAVEADRAEALRLAEHALRLDPALNEAAFNRCLALKALGRSEEAARGFTQMAERGGPWSAAAREQLRGLTGRGDPRP